MALTFHTILLLSMLILGVMNVSGARRCKYYSSTTGDCYVAIDQKLVELVDEKLNDINTYHPSIWTGDENTSICETKLDLVQQTVIDENAEYLLVYFEGCEKNSTELTTGAGFCGHVPLENKKKCEQHFVMKIAFYRQTNSTVVEKFMQFHPFVKTYTA